MSVNKEVILVPLEREGAANWDPSASLAPRQPLGKGVDVEYESGIATVRIQGSPALPPRNLQLTLPTTRISSSSSSGESNGTPGTPQSPSYPSGSLGTTEHKRSTSQTPSQLSAATAISSSSSSSAGSHKSAKSGPPSTQQPSSRGMPENLDTPSASGLRTRTNGKLTPVQEKKQPELDNISIISDIPSEPGGTSMTGTIRSYQASLSTIDEDTIRRDRSRTQEPNNNTPASSVDKDSKENVHSIESNNNDLVTTPTEQIALSNTQRQEYNDNAENPYSSIPPLLHGDTQSQQQESGATITSYTHAQSASLPPTVPGNRPSNSTSSTLPSSALSQASYLPLTLPSQRPTDSSKSRTLPSSSSTDGAVDNVRIELQRFTVPAKKVSWNENVIVTTTNSDNVLLAGLPYDGEGSESSSTSSSRNSGATSTSPLPSPTDSEAPIPLTNLHHRSASRIYSRKAPSDPTPIVDEFELAQLGQMLGSREIPQTQSRSLEYQAPPPTTQVVRFSRDPYMPPYVSQGSYAPHGPALVLTPYPSIGASSLSEEPSFMRTTSIVTCTSEQSTEPKVKKRSRLGPEVSKGVFIFAIVLIVLCFVALLTMGILYKYSQSHNVEDPKEVIKSMKSSMVMKETRRSDVWVSCWANDGSQGNTLYLVSPKAKLPWQTPAEPSHMAWHRGSPIKVYVMNRLGEMNNLIVGDPYKVEYAEVHVFLEPEKFYAAELLDDDDDDDESYALISITTESSNMPWKDLKSSEIKPGLDGKAQDVSFDDLIHRFEREHLDL